MDLHLDKELFTEMIDTLNTRTGIALDIIEKDYYVCLVLREIAKNQSETKIYFKGGTAIYKILNEMYRFSEDIDLTVKILDNESNTQNRKRLKKSALGYDILGLELSKEDTIDNKGSITAIYRYSTAFENENIPLYRAGEIQIESTSFTVSEPYQKYTIEPLIYKLSTKEERKILEENFDVKAFEIEIIKLERMFVDKMFAAEFYYARKMYKDTVKHLYDLTNLYKTEAIKKLFENDNELIKLVNYKRKEEKARIGGIPENLNIQDFSYFRCEFCQELLEELERMQDKYVLNFKYKISVGEVKNALQKIRNKIKEINL